MLNLRNHIEKVFEEYTANYDISDPKVKLKVNHTYRVAVLCEKIARSLELNESDIEIAWTCGMLHDIGRFEQIRKYGTFTDSVSVNHAQFGADLLFKEGLYGRFVPDGNEDERRLIETTIRLHNVFRLPENISDRERLFANILRDADKIDILRANCETPTEDVYNVSTDELKNASVSEDVKEAFKAHKCIVRREGMTAVDHLTGHVCFVFELVFAESRKLMFNEGYLFKLLDFESLNEDTRKWFDFMKKEMKSLQEKVDLYLKGSQSQ